MTGIAVIGNNDFILGFKLAGIHKTFIEEQVEPRVVSLLSEKDIDILVVHDEDYKKFSSGLKKRIYKSIKPIVIAVGSLEEDDLRARIKKVIGVDLYKK
jgi:V/A-type H+-transporting ATPase subunit F